MTSGKISAVQILHLESYCTVRHTCHKLISEEMQSLVRFYSSLPRFTGTSLRYYLNHQSGYISLQLLFIYFIFQYSFFFFRTYMIDINGYDLLAVSVTVSINYGSVVFMLLYIAQFGPRGIHPFERLGVQVRFSYPSIELDSINF